MRILFVTVMLFLASLFELAVGNWGIALPFVGGAVFYFTVTDGKFVGVALAVIAGIVMELLYQREWFFAFLPLLPWLIGWWWGRSRSVTTLAGVVFPAILIGAGAIAPLYGWRLVRCGFRTDVWLEMGAMTFFAMLFMALWMPLTVWWWDIWANRLGMNLYQQREDS